MNTASASARDLWTKKVTFEVELLTAFCVGIVGSRPAESGNDRWRVERVGHRRHTLLARNAYRPHIIVRDSGKRLAFDDSMRAYHLASQALLVAVPKCIVVTDQNSSAIRRSTRIG